MQLLDLTLPTPAENLALDEALLAAAEASEIGDCLRIWEHSETFVVIGRSSRHAEEVNIAACRAANVPIFRRPSGGAAIVAGRGCLMFSLVQAYSGREHLRQLDQLHAHVLGTIRRSIDAMIPGAVHIGTCDLAIDGRKFSGNAVRCKRDHFLYHGTLLYNFDLAAIERLLRLPPRQPDYRQGRSHSDFVMNLPLNAQILRHALTTTFQADQPLKAWPQERTQQLTTERYTQPTWTYDRLALSNLLIQNPKSKN